MAAELTAVEFAMEDEVNGKPLSPANVSLPMLTGFLEEIQAFVKGDQPGLTLADSKVQIVEGSLKIIIDVGEVLADSIHRDLESLKTTGDLDLVQRKRAEVFKTWQGRAGKSDRRKYAVGGGSLKILITRQSHFEHGNERAWVAVEKYFTGKIYNAGGKKEPNVHLQLDDGTSIRVDATEQQLAAVEGNVLFKEVTLRVGAEQHLQMGALRNYRLIEIRPYSAEIDEEALSRLWKKGREAWADVKSATEWVEELRGNR